MSATRGVTEVEISIAPRAGAKALDLRLQNRNPVNPVTTFLLCLALVWHVGFAAAAADTFTWRTNQNLVSADIQYRPLGRLLEQITAATGWKVFVEPGTTHDVSAKFKDLPPGEALRLLLGDLNFALVPETNASPRLFVFRTAQRNATEL